MVGRIAAEPATPAPDPLIWSTFAAAVAPTLKLGICILIVPQRNPLILARELATLAGGSHCSLAAIVILPPEYSSIELR